MEMPDLIDCSITISACFRRVSSFERSAESLLPKPLIFETFPVEALNTSSVLPKWLISCLDRMGPMPEMRDSAI